MKLWTYKHYKGKNYQVLWEVLHTETEEILILYKALYDTGLWEMLFVRPKDIFFESIELDGKKCRRFEYIGDKKYWNI